MALSPGAKLDYRRGYAIGAGRRPPPLIAEREAEAVKKQTNISVIRGWNERELERQRNNYQSGLSDGAACSWDDDSFAECCHYAAGVVDGLPEYGQLDAAEIANIAARVPPPGTGEGWIEPSEQWSPADRNAAGAQLIRIGR